MKKLQVVIVLLLVLTILGVIWWKNGTQAANKDDKTPRLFVVRPKQGIREIANSLKKQGLIKDPIVFFFLVEKLGVDKKIQAGDHRISPSMPAYEVAKSLTLATNDVWVTIPEGFRAQEIADILEKNIPSFEKSWRKTLEENEGHLFPDTYLIPKTATVSQVVKILKNNFDNKFLEISNNKTGGIKDEDIVIVASLVEREAKLSKDRPLVASVIYNRLKIGMKLDIDATVQYVLGYQETEKRWWKKNLTFEDLKINSPYNTYINAGLPPTPISNPGLSSLNAAANPVKTSYLYYISDKKGANHYAETIEEHNANKAKYLSE